MLSRLPQPPQRLTLRWRLVGAIQGVALILTFRAKMVRFLKAWQDSGQYLTRVVWSSPCTTDCPISPHLGR
jgi:hypothetical protein